jgi:carbonic anhydrase
VEIIKKSPPIAERIKTGKIAVVGAYYHLKSGEVTLLD